MLRIFFLKGKLLAKCGQDIASAAVPDPTGDILGLHAGLLEDRAGVASGEFGDFGGEEVAEETLAMVEAERVAVLWFEMGDGFEEANGAFGGGRLGGEDGGGGSVSKKAGTDENAGVVIEVGGGGADFHADDEDVFGQPGGNKGGGLLNGGQGGPATEADEIEKGEGGFQAETLGEITGQTGAKVSGAGGHEEGIDLGNGEARFFDRLAGGGFGEGGGVLLEAGHHLVGLENESVLHFF